MALAVRIMPRAQRQIDAAAAWWSEHRPAAPGAVANDLEAALDALARQPAIVRVLNARHADTRRLYLARVRYFIYYRIHDPYLDVVAFWHASRGAAPSI